MVRTANTLPGEAWGFGQTSSSGGGYWYEIGIGRIDEEGRGLGKLLVSPFRNFTGDIIICPHGSRPPGRAPTPSFPLVRRGGEIEAADSNAPLGVTWGFSSLFRSRGYPLKMGTGWFDEQGRAHCKFYLTILTGFRGIIIICPPGIDPPPGPYPPQVALTRRAGEINYEDEGGDGEEPEE